MKLNIPAITRNDARKSFFYDFAMFTVFLIAFGFWEVAHPGTLDYVQSIPDDHVGGVVLVASSVWTLFMMYIDFLLMSIICKSSSHED